MAEKNKKSTIELEDVPEMLNKSKKLDIEYFDWTKEAGGVIMGHREYGPFNNGHGWRFEIDDLLQMPNSAKAKDRYQVPNIIVFTYYLLKWYLKHGIKLASGVTIIGEFHSDFYNNLGFSKEDNALIMKRCRRHGIWVAGVMIHKHRNTGKMLLKPYGYNPKTISKKPGRGMR